MEIKDMTAVQLSAAIKEGKITVADAVEASLAAVKASEEAIHAFLLVDEEVQEHARQKCRRKLTQESSPVRWPAFRLRSRTTSVRKVLRRRVRQRSCRTLFRRTMQRLSHGSKRREPLSSERQTWMSLRWEVRQRLPRTA